MDIYQRLEPAKADSSIIKSFAEQNMKWNPQSKIILVMYHKWLSIYRWVAFFSDLVVYYHIWVDPQDQFGKTNLPTLDSGTIYDELTPRHESWLGKLGAQPGFPSTKGGRIRSAANGWETPRVQDGMI